MATTKILKEDLDAELRRLLNDVSTAKGESPSLTERLSSAGWVKLDLLEKPVRDTIKAIMDGETTAGKSITDRLTDAEKKAGTTGGLSTKINMLAEYGNFTETFAYDPSGNVSKHTVTGDAAFTIDYVYKDAAAGTLNYSEKKYTDENGKAVTIKKVYTYDATTGNITGMTTTTTVV